MRVAGNTFYTIKLKKSENKRLRGPPGAAQQALQLYREYFGAGSWRVSAGRLWSRESNPSPGTLKKPIILLVTGGSQDDPRGVVWPLSGSTPPRGGVLGGEGVSLLLSESITCSRTSLSQAGAGRR